LGMLAGSEGPGGIAFENYRVAFRVGTMSMVLILFEAGLNTPRRLLREAGAAAAMLATVGVVATALLVGACARALGMAWGEALLLGAIWSSTAAAAVFSVLRSTGLQLRRRIAATLEAESGFNDPMALVLTIALTEALRVGRPLGPHAIGEAALQLAIGALLGVAF